MFLINRIKINNIYHDVIESLVEALEAKDSYTRGHSERVADFSYKLAKSLGIRGTKLEQIHIAAHLHDIGKIGVPDRVLNKKGKLSSEDWEHIRKHPTIGYNILKKSNKLKFIAKIVLCHHERWDGNGYPLKLKGDKIPEGSRIIAVSDTIDAMMSKRSYRKALSLEVCKQELIKNKGIMFEPKIVEHAIDILDKNFKFVS